MKKKFLGRILKFIKEENLLSKGDRVLLALSGGADSVFMAEMFMDISSILGVYFECAHINHGIRGDEAKRDEAFVRDFCKKRDIPITVERIDGLTPHMSALEEVARKKRYELLERIRNLRGLDFIATAHTMDDSVETMLHNLLRGTGLKGLRGILPRRGRIIRPVLVMKKSEILEYLKSAGVDFVLDSSNLDDRFTRNYIRNRIVPLLHRVNPEFKMHLFRTGLIVKRHFEWVENAFEDLRNKMLITSRWVDVYRLSSSAYYHPDVLLGLLRIYREAFVYDEAKQFLDLITKGNGLVNIKGLVVNYSMGNLAFLKDSYTFNIAIRSPDEVFYEKDLNYQISFKTGKAKGSMECNIPDDMFPFTLRTRKAGDRVNKKKLKDRFIALKIPYWKRSLWPVFEKDGEIFFVPGIYKKHGLKGNLKVEVKKYEGERFSIFD